MPAGFSGGFDLNGWDASLHPSRGVLLRPKAVGAGEWASLGGAGTGLNGTVYDIEFQGGVLYAGGFFTDAGGDPDADYIAKFSGGVWSSLAGPGSGLNNSVHDIEFDSGVLYAGGQFTDAGGDTNADRIAKFSGGVWSSLGGVGLGSPVEDIEIDSGIVYVGGSFTNAGGNANANHIAQFDGSAWSALGGGLNTTVRTLAFNGGVLYAGGSFINAGGDQDADHIAKFDGASWSSLGGAGTGLSSTVYDIEFDGGVLYAVGAFTAAGGNANADRIAQFSGGVWSSLGGVGLSGFTYEVEVDGGVVYAGGAFSDTGGDPDADGIAQFSGGVWSAVGTGLGTVRDITFNAGALYAGGGFTAAGGDPDADNIAQFALPASGGGSSGSSDSSGSSISKAIVPSGVTTLELGRIIVSVLATAIPPGQTGCVLTIQQSADSSAVFGFTLDDTVWDVKVHCNGSELSIFFDALTVCVRPVDGVLANKNVYHSHNAGSFEPLSGGQLSGYVCGQTRLLSLFTLGQLALPNTGFAPGRVSTLAEQPAEAAYAATDLSLSIPKLGVELSILGVPQSPNGWDVSWLQANQAGYLYGTSFPTWEGNSALTAHVWNADNTPGPFYELKSLQYGDRFTVSAYGYTYTYEVRSNRLMSPGSLVALNDSPYNLITLITCESFSELTGDYLHRRAVQAVLVDVQ
ncbi:MAG: sortase [Anaerolineales bacterium]|nr:MAG: sortase [Anaerolineales bacterium]